MRGVLQPWELETASERESQYSMARLKSPSAFLSLPPFEWDSIPRLTVLTGINGVGKSHLLRLLASAAGLPDAPDRFVFGASAFEWEPRPSRGAHLPALWQLSDVTVSNDMFSVVDKLVEQVRTTARLGRSGASIEAALNAVIEHVNINVLAAGRNLPTVEEMMEIGERVTHADIFDRLGPYDLVTRGAANPIEPLAQIFYAYVNADFTRFMRGIRRTAEEAAGSRPPWDMANDLLELFDVGFRLVPPIDLRFPYSVRCRLLAGKDLVKPSDLSSGEQAILALVAIQVVAELRPLQSGDGGMLLLLDEPDAHLHTSLIKDYLQHLETLTARNLQIVMVTHRPETILLCPDESLVEMRRERGGLSFTPVPRPARPELIARFAADSIAVLPSVRIVLVEDEDDRGFHQTAYDLALNLPAVALRPNPRLAFMPVMAKAGGGGWMAVVKRLGEFREQEFQSVVHGLIDGDNKTDRPGGVVRLERYSIESYWADPIGLYEWSVRLADGVGRDLAAVGRIEITDLADLRTFAAARLQPAADAVITKLETKLPADLSRGRREVVLYHKHGSVTLRYPNWLWTATKAQLEDAVTKTFVQQVRDAWKRTVPITGLIPADLVEAYRVLITERL